jgi:transposase
MQEELFSKETNDVNINSQQKNNKDIKYPKRFFAYTPDQFLMLNFNPEKTFPVGTFERFLVETIKDLNLEEIEYSLEKDKGGRYSHNPKTMLGLIYYGFSNGVFSSRKIAELSVYDYRYMFLAGGSAPDHSSISRFLNKYRKEIIDIFTKVLYIAENLGYRDFKQEVVDGSKIKASAGSKFTGTIDDFEKRKNNLEKKIEEAIKKQIETDKKDVKEYYRKKVERYKKEKEKINDFLFKVKKKLM